MFKVSVMHIEAGLSAPWNRRKHTLPQCGVHHNTSRMETSSKVRLSRNWSRYTNSLILPHYGNVVKNDTTDANRNILARNLLPPHFHRSPAAIQSPGTESRNRSRNESRKCIPNVRKWGWGGGRGRGVGEKREAHQSIGTIGIETLPEHKFDVISGI
ncbi:hypothetical protein TNCV_852081 [Trichonephila clavipes]|nr:hypothetical protein TNCV_852081 [Trichonephila clavipes]